MTLVAGAQGGAKELYDWNPIGQFGLNADGLSIPVLFTIAVLSTVISIFSMPYMAHIIGEKKSEYALYNALYLLYAIGMMGAVLATNLIEFYLFFELMLIPSFFLIARWGYGDRTRISFMYFMWTHVGALALLAGILTTWLLAGSFDLATIASAALGPELRVFVVGLFLFGLLVKMAAFGLHIWLPYAHAEAPTPISALLSPAMIGIGGYAIVRIVVAVYPSVLREVSTFVAIWALVTMVYGGLMAFTQDDLKRMMAYSSISQMGYILLGISSVQLLGLSGSMFHYFSHGMGKGMLFMVAGAIILQAHGTRSISKLGGLAQRMPITAAAALLGFLTIMGVPPLSGFLSEFLIFAGVFNSSLLTASYDKLTIAILAVISTAITAGYCLLTMKRVFFGRLPDELASVKEAPATVTAPIVTLAVLAVVVGILPEYVTSELIRGIAALLGA
jgi:NADH-quinone oxidoreductase subunit M